MIHRDRPLFRTLANVPEDLRVQAVKTIRSIESDWPNLPGVSDEAYRVPLAAPRWRRRVAASSWWVVYSWGAESRTLILRTVNDLG